ncbi:MAG TPA: DedA family protein [Aliidongia sp.]|jgi:membrane protein DedA with SNARE-associated domain|nr:DedA family protein [Aliidongia sp.]
MAEIQRLVHEYREWFYLITIAWTFFEGETFVLLAGTACASGLIDPVWLVASAWLGSYLGDQCWFFLGRKCGPLLLRRFPDWRHGIDMVHRWLERWDTIFILTFRFIYGIRNFSSVAMGLSDLNVFRFMILNFIAAGIWAVTFVGAGYLFGHEMSHLLGNWGEGIELVALGIFLTVVITVLLVSRWRARRAKRAALITAERWPTS